MPITFPAMRAAEINGRTVKMLDKGSGDPVVVLHGGMGDECFAVLEEQALAARYG